MLINEPSMTAGTCHPILKAIAEVNGNSGGVTQLADGIYQIGHFSGDMLLPKSYEKYPDFYLPDGESNGFVGMLEDRNHVDFERGAYGVCDNYQQVLDHYPELTVPGREFVLMLTEVRRDAQPERGGWRWHKWGSYIGTFNAQHEYLFDEATIERVFCFHIYEKKENK